MIEEMLTELIDLVYSYKDKISDQEYITTVNLLRDIHREVVVEDTETDIAIEDIDYDISNNLLPSIYDADGNLLYDYTNTNHRYVRSTFTTNFSNLNHNFDSSSMAMLLQPDIQPDR